MKRREFLSAGLALAAGCALKMPASKPPNLRSRVRPSMAGWPSDTDWAKLNQQTHGRLSRVTIPNQAGAEAATLLANPFYVGEQPGLTQSCGWLDAWQSTQSAYMVAAQSAGDVAATVRFARDHNLRLVVKGRGHSYLGASSAPDSLLIWTNRMDAVVVHDAFVPAGSSAAAVPAISVGAGCMWLHAYQAATSHAGRYVQGGGCTTVGVAGLVLGGGFGSFSKAFGTACSSLLEAEIITADGKTRVVNHAQEPDLFWALKGGGGGTFGVVTRLTLATHALPATFGAVVCSIQAKSADAYRRLLGRFVDLYATSLCNPNWGEQVRAKPDNTLEIAMVFQGLTAEQARAAWRPLIDSANSKVGEYEGQKSLIVLDLPARDFWNPQALRRIAPAAIRTDNRPGASSTDFWWSGNTEEVGAFWHAYTSAWLPASLLQPQNRSRLVDAWFAASRHWEVAFHFNKGLAGATPAVLNAARDTAMNPDVLDAFALAIVAAQSSWQGRPARDSSGALQPGGNSGQDLSSARSNRDRVAAAMRALRAAAPDTGAYVNECDYFQSDWQKAFWGRNYPRLARIKGRYDPDGLFFVHHGVGSEDWSADGFTRIS